MTMHISIIFYINECILVLKVHLPFAMTFHCYIPRAYVHATRGLSDITPLDGTPDNQGAEVDAVIDLEGGS